MEYFLAFDKGNAYNDFNRYVSVPNSLLHDTLAQNYNLKALCEFTCQFDDEEDLKDIIIRLNPCFLDYKDCSLVIMWERRVNKKLTINCNGVPYKTESIYFCFDNIVDFILNRVYSSFFNDFLDYYQNHTYLQRELETLYSSIQDYKSLLVIEQDIRRFLRRLLYKGNELEFSKLYKLVMFISKYLNSEKQRLGISETEDFSLESLEHSSLSEAQEFEESWLKRRARLRKLGLW